MPVQSYNKSIDYFSIYCSFWCTGTNSVTPVDFWCGAAVLQILWCFVIKIELCMACVFHWCHQQCVLFFGH